MKNKVKQIAMMAILIALSLILSYVDSLIVLPFGIPGIKLGIANIAIIYTLYKIAAPRRWGRRSCRSTRRGASSATR